MNWPAYYISIWTSAKEWLTFNTNVTLFDIKSKKPISISGVQWDLISKTEILHFEKLLQIFAWVSLKYIFCPPWYSISKKLFNLFFQIYFNIHRIIMEWDPQNKQTFQNLLCTSLLIHLKMDLRRIFDARGRVFRIQTPTIFDSIKFATEGQFFYSASLYSPSFYASFQESTFSHAQMYLKMWECVVYQDI